jgi:small subunit ribosomal protein S13
MARVVGVNIPGKQQVQIGLCAVYGIGRTRAAQICVKVGLSPEKKVKDLTETELNAINQTIRAEEFNVEGDLRREVALNIKRLVDLRCYRGDRHRRGLPVRGQGTRTNARTRKGRRKGKTAKG